MEVPWPQVEVMFFVPLLSPILPRVPTRDEVAPAEVPTPSPRQERCSEIGCDAPAVKWVRVPVSGPRGDDMDPVSMPYCAECAELPGLEIASMSDWPCWPIEPQTEEETPDGAFDANDPDSKWDRYAI